MDKKYLDFNIFRVEMIAKQLLNDGLPSEATTLIRATKWIRKEVGLADSELRKDLKLPCSYIEVQEWEA